MNTAGECACGRVASTFFCSGLSRSRTRFEEPVRHQSDRRVPKSRVTIAGVTPHRAGEAQSCTISTLRARPYRDGGGLVIKYPICMDTRLGR